MSDRLLSLNTSGTRAKNARCDRRSRLQIRVKHFLNHDARTPEIPCNYARFSEVAKTRFRKMESADNPNGGDKLMIRTRDRHKVGTTDYRAHIVYLVALPDPHALGNWGLEGFDEEGEHSPPFKTHRAAVAWMRRTIASHPERQWRHGQVQQDEWRGDDIDDDEYGVILDAYAERTHVWDFYVSDGELQADGDWEDRGN